MRSLLVLSMACLLTMFPEPVSAQKHHAAHKHHHHHRGHSYPRYYGRTWGNPGWSVSGYSSNYSFNFSFPGSSYYGSPWGPYFYNRFGYYSTNAFIAGDPGLISGGYSLNGFYPILPGLGYSAPVVYPYSNVPGTLPTFPGSTPTPLNAPGLAASNVPLNNALNEDIDRWKDKNYLPKPSRKVQRHIIPSSRNARELSLRNQVKGDEYFKKQDYRRAYDRYKLAASLAKDIAAPHFKKGFALVALKQYSRAAFEFKQGLILDPSWPVTGESLAALFGPDNVIAKDSVLHQVAAWVKEDIRDPDRLFVFGVVLHFDGRVEEATDVIRTAARLAGRGDHFLAFLAPQTVAGEKKKGNQSGYLIDPKQTRKPAFELKKKSTKNTPPPPSTPASKPLTLPPPTSSSEKLPKINNLPLPPLPQDADAAGAPLIPLPEPVKNQPAPLLIPPN